MERLEAMLSALDGKGYKGYKRIKGDYRFPAFRLTVDHVQGDPYAAPSRLRAMVPWERAALPAHAVDGEARACAARDFIGRSFRRAARSMEDVAIDAGHQSVLDRSAVLFRSEGVELRFTVNLPARGRSILGRRAQTLLCRELPDLIERSSLIDSLDADALRQHCDAIEDQQALRAQLVNRGLVAFVADGAILPRRSGIDDRPLPEAIRWVSPDTLRVSLTAPNAGEVAGTGVPAGITLIVGGGFHGKSTLLTALETGVYDHRPGDGRERVVAVEDATKIRAEDGRAVHAVDLSPFINHLPYGKSTVDFSTRLASGSTSQAAALQEALEMGVSALLVDEDTSATNFMIRDERMQALVAKEDEPITPFVDRIAELRDRLHVSTVLVMGGSGDYFTHADTVIQMHDYRPREVTAEAHRIAEAHGQQRRSEADAPLARPAPRRLRSESVDPAGGRGKPRIKARGSDVLVYGRGEVDLRAVEQLVDPSQVRAIGGILNLLARVDGEVDDVGGWIGKRLAAGNVADLFGQPLGDLARPRSVEVAAALNRLRDAVFVSGAVGRR